MPSQPPLIENESPESLALPLSVGQTDVWRAQRLAPASTSYNIGGYADIFCAVDHSALERAIRRELERTETHHFRFIESADGPRQYSAKLTNFRLAAIDMSGHVDPQSAAISWMREYMDTPFDLAGGPLFRYALIKVADEHMIWFAAWHHLIADAFAAPLFMRRIVDSYVADLDGTALDNDPWTTWDEFLRDETEYARSARHDRDRIYWRELLEGHPDAVTLSGKSPTWPDKAIESRVSIPRGLVAQLEKLGAAHNCTLAAVMLAVTAAYLSRMTGFRDIVIGMPVTARTSPKLRQVVGFLSNVVPIRLAILPNAPFSNLLRLAGARAREAFRHQRYWASAIRRDLGLAANAPNIFGTVMNFVPNNAEREIAGRPVVMHAFANSQRVEDLMINVDVRSDTADMEVQFSGHSANYDLPGLRRHQQRFLQLLEGVGAYEDVLVARLPLCEAEERVLLLREWSGARSHTRAQRPDSPETLPRLFEAQVRGTPDAVALVFGELSLSYTQLNEQSNHVAHALIERGVGPESLVGLCAERSVQLVIGILGILKAGGAYLPLDPAYPARRWRTMLEQARAPLVLSSRGTVGRWAAGAKDGQGLPEGTALLVLEDIAAATPRRENNPDDAPGLAALKAENAAYVIYTSGSSGTPKGVLVSHGSLLHSTLARLGRYGPSAPRFLLLSSYGFDSSIAGIFWTLCSGGTLLLPADAEHADPQAIARLIAAHSATHVLAVPVLYSRLLERAPWDTLQSLTTVIVAGETCPIQLVHRHAQQLSWAALYNEYGPTECSVWSTVHQCGALDTGSVPIGRPIEGARVYVLDESLEPAPIGVTGEIYIGGAGVARGYVNQFGLTAERFVADPYGEPGSRMYRSGDLARWRSDGALEYLGRVDQQIKLRGFRVELGEIEAALLTNPLIAHAAVKPQPERDATYLAAYVVRRVAEPLDTVRIRMALAQVLPEHMIPMVFVDMPSLPLTPNGKLDRRALPIPERQARHGVVDEAPQGQFETALADVLIDLLGIQRIGRHDRFFELGLNSLILIDVIEQMARRGWRIEARQVFERPTIAELTGLMNSIGVGRKIPPGRIDAGCERITPAMLPLIALDQAQISAIVGQVPGGAGNVQDIYGLAPLQEGLLIHHRVSGGEDVYLLRTLLSFASRERVAEFVAALQKVIDRHDVLRTSFLWEGLPSAVQVVWRHAGLSVETIDVEAKVPRQALWQISGNIDVRTAPLIKGHLARDGYDGSWLLLLTWHHLVIDHTTLELILKEVGAHLAGHHTRLPAPVPFRNFVAETRFDNPPDAHEAFFREMLQDVDEPTAPFGLLESARSGQEFAERRIDLDRHLSLGLREQARLMGVTPSSLFHLAWGLLLARTSGRTDVVFGTVLFGRMHGAAGVDRAFGLFMNTLPLRLRLGRGPVADAVRSTHALLGRLLLHEHALLSVAQRSTALPAATPLISALLNYRHTRAGDAVIAGREIFPGIELLRAEERTHYPMVLMVDDLAVDFSLTVQAPPAVGPDRICGMMQSALESLLRALVCTPQADVRTLEVLRDAERCLLLGQRDLLGQTLPSVTTLPTCVELIEKQCGRIPDATAVQFEESGLTYGALNEAANRIAHRLHLARIKRGDLVALCMPRSPLLLAALLAVQKCGAAYLPLDPEFPVDRLGHMLSDSGSQYVLSAGNFPDRLVLPDASRLLDVSAAMEPSGDSWDLSLGDSAGPLDLAYVIYTSGSTGRPKGVAISRAALGTNLRAMQQRLTLTDSDVVAATTTVSFDPAFVELFLPLMVGARIELVPRETVADGRELAKWLAARRPTVLQATPTTWRSLLNAGWSGDRRLRALSGGEAMPRDLADALLERTAEVWNLYGPTETTIWSAICKVERSAEKMVPIGHPIEGMKYYVLDAALEPAPIGATGELYIAGTGLARGYFNRPALTAARFVPDPHGEPGARMYRSGDLARWRPDGNLDYLGRNDQQVKLRGARIELGEIEAALRELGDVEEAAVVVRGAGDAEHLAAYAVPRSGTEIDTGKWRRRLAARLPSYMVPSAFISLREMPLTPSGKLDRRALPAAAPSILERPYERPKTATERRIESIWREVLRVERIGRDDSFFELGGHSLTVLRVASRLRDEFGLEMPLKILFDAPTLASMAEQIDQALIDRVDPPQLPTLVATEWHEPSPLSYSQERIWLIQSLNPTTTAYNIAVAVKLHGQLDLATICESFDQMMRRHEILRTKVCLVEDQPRQVVELWRVGALEVIELRGEHTEAEVARQAMVQARIPFDLLRDSILRARLYRLDHDVNVLTLIVHHIAADQWSIGIIGRELAALYNAQRKGAPVRLEALPVNYRDYARWQRSGAVAVAFDRQLAYWRRQLANLPAVDLPIDRPRPKLWTLRGATYERPLEAELLTAIAQFGHRAGATLFTALFAGFAALLHRITGQTDIPVGVPVANRTHTAVEGLVGTFVNTVVLRSDLKGDPCFAELLRRLKDTTVEAFAAQDVSFDRLVQEIGQRGDPSRAPLVQVMFNVVNAPMHGIEFEGLTWEPLSIDVGGAQFELSFTIDTEITHILSVTYSTELFDHSTVERMVGQYLTLLSGAIAAPEKRIGGLPLLPEEQLAVLRHWNDTAISLPRMPSLVALFEATAAASPNVTAISVGEVRLSYAELNAHANRLAAALCALNVDRSALVAVCMSRSPLLLIGLLSIQKCGAAYLPLDPEFPAERLSYMLEDSGASLMLTSGGLPAGMLSPEAVKVLDADAVLNRDPGPSADPATFAANLDRYPQPCDTAYVIYTSGSSGRPKGVVVSHGALLNFLHSMRVRPGLTAHDVLAAVTTMSFDIAALELYLPLMVGARIELVPRQTASDGAALARLLERSGATVLQATPVTWRMLIEAGWSGGDGFRALCGGEALSRTLADSILRCVGELWNLYGPTETTVWSTVERIESGTSAISIGRPIANTQVHILDPAGEQVPVGVVGEIAIGGDGLADGYHRRPALTAERFVPDCRAATAGRRLYLTGDLGRWGADGKLYHLGRRDTQVKIRGFRIELAEIERVLEEQAEVWQAIVVVRDAGMDDPRLIAYATFRPGQDLTMGEVKARLRRRLPEFMVPSVVIPLLSMPVTPNGKADRAALPDPFRRELPSREPPATATERIVADIWKSVLKIESVWAYDNFFDLGGYSLLSLRVVKLIEDRTGRQLDPRVLFFKDLRQVAALLETEPAPAPTASSDV